MGLVVTDQLVVHLVQRPKAIERSAADLRRDSVGVIDVENGIAARPERDARVLARKVSGLPETSGDRLDLLGVRRYCNENDERREIVVQRAQPVRSPCAEARL